MEVLGIGRPSTYSSCVNNVLKKEYTEIRNVPGIEKETNMISMNYKNEIKEKKTKQIIGKESRKLIPTEYGIKVNKFLINNCFMDIKDISCTKNWTKKIPGFL